MGGCCDIRCFDCAGCGSLIGEDIILGMVGILRPIPNARWGLWMECVVGGVVVVVVGGRSLRFFGEGEETTFGFLHRWCRVIRRVVVDLLEGLWFLATFGGPGEGGGCCGLGCGAASIE